MKPMEERLPLARLRLLRGYHARIDWKRDGGTEDVLAPAFVPSVLKRMTAAYDHIRHMEDVCGIKRRS
jgi:hypothetical protein